MEEIAARVGVSRSTVSFVLGGGARRLKISPQTRERVMGVARELGYQRNQIARAMVTGKSRIIGVLTTFESGENIVRILSGAMEATSENDYLLKILHFSYTNVDDATIARCLEWRLAGALIVGFSEEAQKRLHDVFREHAIPVTLIDNAPPLDQSSRIASDDEQGIREVVSHLVGLGHRRIAFVGGTSDYLSERRERFFRAALADACLDAPDHWIQTTSWHIQSEIEAGVRALFAKSGDHPPTAVMCSGDALAMVVMGIAREMGLRVPHDLSITGYSNMSLSEFTYPALTTVDQSFREMGHAAALQAVRFAERADAADDGPSASGESELTLVPTRLIHRASTAPPPPER